MQSADVLQSAPELPKTGMIDIVFRGEVKNVTAQLAKTLIDKGSAKLKV